MANKRVALICGEASKGKTASLRNLKKVLLANCEAGKDLPFKATEFKPVVIQDPYQLEQFFDYLEKNDDFDYGVIDGFNYLLEMFVSVHIRTAADGRAAWGDYAEYIKQLMQQYLASCTKPILFTAHTRTIYNESSMAMETKVPVQGGAANIGIESYFTTVVAAKVMSVDDLRPYEGELLTITPREEAMGFKHVFQTMITKETLSERIRSPMGMFADNEIYMDNDAALLLKRMNEYYE